MTATYTKPTKVPRWADTTSHITEPTEGKKDLGWVFEDAPPSDVENWRTKLVGNWFKWLDERFNDGTGGTPKDDFQIMHPGSGYQTVYFEADKITWRLDDNLLIELTDEGEWSLKTPSGQGNAQGAHAALSVGLRACR